MSNDAAPRRARESNDAGPRGRERPRARRRTKAAPPPLGQRDAQLLAGTLMLTLIAYSVSLGNGFVDFDDPENVVENYSIRELSLANLGHYFSSPLQYMYTPLVSISYAIDYQIGELSPAMYHVTNLLLHLGNVVLVFFVFHALTQRTFVAHFMAAAFAIHPMNVDGVAWISTRSGLLATAFSLGSLLAYIHYARSGRWRHLAVSSALFLLATLSKSPAVVLPVVLFLIDYYLRRERRWRLVLEKLPFFAIAVIMGIVALNVRVDAVNPFGYTLIDRFFIVCSALVSYLASAVFPFGLSFAHAYPPKYGAFLPWYLYLSPLVLALVAWGLLRLPRSRRIVVFGLLFFTVTILLSQTVLLIDNFKANRYAYLPYLGVFLIAAHVADRYLNGPPARRIPQLRTGVTIALVAIAVVFSSVTLVRNRSWRDTATIMTDSIENEPGVAFVYNSRGISRYKAGDHAGAQADFDQTLALDPDFVLSFYYMGILKHSSGDYRGALADFDRVIARYPGFAAAYNERGRAKLALNDNIGALDDFSVALALDEYLANAYHYRGVAELASGSPEAALRDQDRAIELDSDHADAYHQRALARSRLGDKTGACADWDRARSLGNPEAATSFTENCPPS
jgi:protein O-mannosyl-transferase